MIRHRLLLHGSLAGLVIGTAISAGWAARPYTCTATLRVLPQQIPERFVPALPTDAHRILPYISQTLLSRGNLINLANSHGLYSDHSPEGVVRKLRDTIQFSLIAGDSFTVSFSHRDPSRAREITTALVSGVVREWMRNRQTMAVLTHQFMKDSAAAAAKEWEESAAKLRAGPASERARLDVEIARQRYETLSARMAEAALIQEVEKRQQGQTLEIMDTGSLKEDWRPAVWLGSVVGLVAGALLAAAMVRRTRSENFLVESGWDV